MDLIIIVLIGIVAYVSRRNTMRLLERIDALEGYVYDGIPLLEGTPDADRDVNIRNHRARGVDHRGRKSV